MSKHIAPLAESEALDRASKFFRVMGKAGTPWDHFQRAINSVTARRNLAHYLDLGCPKVDGNGVIDTTPTALDLTKLVLGDDFITPEEVVSARGFVYTDEQLETLEQTLPGIEIVAWCKGNGYVLLPNPPEALSLLGVRDLDRGLFYANEGGWYADQAFAREDKTEAGTWLAVRKDIVPNSTKKKWKEQTPLLSEVERVPNAAEASWTLTTYQKVRGVYQLPSVYARTSSLGSGGLRVYVGVFGSDGLDVGRCWDGARGAYFGVASARKF